MDNEHCKKRYGKYLILIAAIAVKHSQGRLNLHFKDDDQTFLECNDVPLGRSLEEYIFRGNHQPGWSDVLLDFCEDVLYKVKKYGLSISYKEAAVFLYTIGTEIYDSSLLEALRFQLLISDDDLLQKSK